MTVWMRTRSKFPFWSAPGEISNDGCWVLVDDCWLYTGSTLLELLAQVVGEWRNDRHMVG